MNHTATRLITLILLLQRKPNQKAANLASELGVSVRTLHRYFEMLDEMGIPVYSERGPYGGFSLGRGYKMPPLVLSPEEAVAVSLGVGMVEELWGSLYREAAHSALVKIENLLPEDQRGEVAWAQRSLIATGMHRGDFSYTAPLLEDLRSAARNHTSVNLTYRGGGSPAVTERQVDPYALVYSWGWWYMVGHCHLRNDVRAFRVDRIQSINSLPEVFTPPDGFDPHPYLQTAAPRPTLFTVRVRFSPRGADVARETRFQWKRTTELPDGSLEAELEVHDMNFAASLILSYAGLVEVLDPPELRELVREWAAGVVSLYDKTTQSMS